MTEFCTNCGALCCGKLKIEVRKGCYYHFCSECFNLFRPLKIKEIIKIIKKNKYSVAIK